MNKNVKLISIVLVIVLIIGGFTFYTLSKNNNKVIENNIKQLKSDESTSEELQKKMEKLGYENYENSSENEKYAYIKTEGKTIKGLIGESKETQFIFIKDYNQEKDKANFYMLKAYENYKYTFSSETLNGKSDNILIERSVYKDCSKEKCVTSEKTEMNIEQYTYSLKTSELKAVGEYENPIKKSDIKADLKIYDTELENIYK